MREAVICEPLRTAVGRFGGVLKEVTVQDLAATVVTEVLARHLPSTRGTEAYLCGPPVMIDAAIDVLKSTGCKERHIYFDRFVPSG